MQALHMNTVARRQSNTVRVDLLVPHSAGGTAKAAAAASAEDTPAPMFPTSQLWGLLLYSISTLLGASTSVIAKLLGGSGGMPVMQLVFVRSCVLMAFTAPHLRDPAARSLIAERHELLAVRGTLGFVSVAMMYTALCLLPLSDAVALAFLSPLLVAALSRPLLQERPHRSVPFALALAAAGALLLARPTTFASLLPGGRHGAAAAAAVSPNPLGVAAALAHAVSAAGAKITVRRLGGGSSSPHIAGAIVLSAGIVGAIGSGAVCLMQRSFVLPKQPVHWLLLAAVGLTGWGHQVAMTSGLQRVPASTASSLTYLSAIWSLLADWLVFRYMPNPASLLGAAAICTAGLLVTLWQHKGGSGGGGSGSGAGGRDGREGSGGNHGGGGNGNSSWRACQKEVAYQTEMARQKEVAVLAVDASGTARKPALE